MAGEKMKDKMESKMMCEVCEGGMGKTCATISGVFVIIAGASFLGFAFGSLTAMTAHLISGGALLLYGIAVFVHGLGLCPLCNKMGK